MQFSHTPSLMAEADLKKLIEEYNLRAKKFNVNLLAVSVLIRKLKIAAFPIDLFPKPVISYVQTELEKRYQTLFIELVEEAHAAMIDPDFTARIETAVYCLHEEIEKSDEVNESTVVTYETGVEAGNQIEKIGPIDIVALVDWVRNYKTFGREKLTDISNFLESNLYEKLRLQILAL